MTQQRKIQKVQCTATLRFDDEAAYERYMGKWSQLAGDAFLDWLAPESGLRWLDVGRGNGAFTESLVERCAPVSVQGIDRSSRSSPLLAHDWGRVRRNFVGATRWRSLSPRIRSTWVMPLVIFFVLDPAKGVAEMARVVCLAYQRRLHPINVLIWPGPTERSPATRDRFVGSTCTIWIRNGTSF